MKKIIGFIALSYFLMACSTYTAQIDAKKFGDLSVSENTMDAKDLGYVSGSKGGFVWSNCDDNARSAVAEIIQAAKLKGANAIGYVRWSAKNTMEPGCTKGWGWVMVPPVLFTPLFMRTKVEAIAYKTGAVPGKKTGFLMLPTSEDEAAVFYQTIISL